MSDETNTVQELKREVERLRYIMGRYRAKNLRLREALRAILEGRGRVLDLAAAALKDGKEE